MTLFLLDVLQIAAGVVLPDVLARRLSPRALLLLLLALPFLAAAVVFAVTQT